MISGMLSDFPTTFEVFSTLLSWAFLAFSSVFLLFSFFLSSLFCFFRIVLSASFLAKTFSLSSSSKKKDPLSLLKTPKVLRLKALPWHLQHQLQSCQLPLHQGGSPYHNQGTNHCPWDMVRTKPKFAKWYLCIIQRPCQSRCLNILGSKPSKWPALAITLSRSTYNRRGQ